ncbi:hypothetical protein BY996DRAFT_6418044 [Phakopsora pachyrhizi]|nr:hypothetical protein BY996DRAFT_6418044 [Phakopsora pachyrhizi]
METVKQSADSDEACQLNNMMIQTTDDKGLVKNQTTISYDGTVPKVETAVATPHTFEGLPLSFNSTSSRLKQKNNQIGSPKTARNTNNKSSCATPSHNPQHPRLHPYHKQQSQNRFTNPSPTQAFGHDRNDQEALQRCKRSNQMNCWFKESMVKDPWINLNHK